MSERLCRGVQTFGIFEPTTIESSLGPLYGPEVPVPIGNNGRVRWALFKTEPAVLQAAIQTEARRLYREIGSLDSDQLLANDGQHLIRGAIRYYPGGIKKLKNDLGVVRLKAEKVVSESTQKPKSYWKSPENIKKEAEAIIEAYGTLTQNTMKLANRSTLSNAIRESYPGGLIQLYRDLGERGRKKTQGYWTPETIEKEAREFIAQFGKLNITALKANRRLDLSAAIQKKYPGGFPAVQKNLSAEPSYKIGYWSKENVEQEAAAFLLKYGVLTQKSLLEHGRGDLTAAISTVYPGKLTALKRELGLEVVEKSKGIRGLSLEDRIAHLEQIARELLEAGQTLINYQLRKNGHGKFLDTVRRSYPGGLKALQEKMGFKTEPLISAEEANTALESLLEG